VIDVVCAVLTCGERVLLVRRMPGGMHGGLWELPGGKVEAPETREVALARELEEELSITADVGPWLGSEGDGRICLHAYGVSTWRGAIALGAHDALCWAQPATWGVLPMPPADARLLAALPLRRSRR